MEQQRLRSLQIVQISSSKTQVQLKIWVFIENEDLGREVHLCFYVVTTIWICAYGLHTVLRIAHITTMVRSTSLC